MLLHWNGLPNTLIVFVLFKSKDSK